MTRYDFARPASLEDDEINIILEKIDQLKSWAEDIEKYAVQRALSGFVWND